MTTVKVVTGSSFFLTKMNVNNAALNIFRSKLSKNGRKCLDEYLSNVKSKVWCKDDEKHFLITYNELLEKHPLPPIRILKLETLIDLGRFPRSPEDDIHTCMLSSIDRDNTLLVFVSHCWLRGHSSAHGWDGNPHPDNAGSDKYALCVEGLQRLKITFAPRMKDCYIWMDYCCMNQNAIKASEAIENYDTIIECCDCLFTPVVDPDNLYDRHSEDIFHCAESEQWNNGSQAYLNRAWCRVEMMCAAVIPILENDSKIDRHTMFDAGLAHHCSQNRRPHFVFASLDVDEYLPPLLLPPLLHSYFNDYHPLLGSLSKKSDLVVIRQLLSEIQPYLDACKIVSSFCGTENSGQMIFSTGDVYVGSWNADMRDGNGSQRYLSGSSFDGQWKCDRWHGYGHHKDSVGNHFRGDFVNGKINGLCCVEYVDGRVFTGEWKDNKYHGQGTMVKVEKGTYQWTLEGVWENGRINRGRFFNANGDVYEGEFRKNWLNGRGTYRWANNDVYEGEFEDGVRQGRGVWHGTNGDVYDGEFKNNKIHGRGKMTYADGSIYDGEWNCKVPEGIGKWEKDGEAYNGEWKNGKFYGWGTFNFANGDIYIGMWKDGLFHGFGSHRSSKKVYCGEWQNGLKCGVGTLRYANGDVFQGHWRDGKQNGSGVLRKVGGGVIEGEWANGRRLHVILSCSLSLSKWLFFFKFNAQ